MNHFLYTNPQIFSQLKTIFVHVPKTGGTSIECTLKTPSQICGGHTSAQAYAKHYPVEWGEFFSFGFVRDPFTRFLSAYRYLAQEKVHPNLGNQIVHSCDFKGFLSLLEADPDMVLRNVHLMPQNAFLCDKNGIIMVDKLYSFENMAEAWDDICWRLGIRKPLPRLNVSRHVDYPEEDLQHAKALVGRLYAGDYGLKNE